MESVTSTDGTEIAYERHGEGPLLVLVHGGAGTRHSWAHLRPHLTDDYTVVLPDRRGRGASGDATDYSLAREAADVATLVDELDGEPTLFGHSFGGLVSLEAAPEVELEHLLLYEPAILPPAYRDDADLADRMQARLDAGDRRGAMGLFFEEAGGVDDVEALPIWPEEVNFGLVETVVRENRAVEAYEPPTGLDADVPTLLLRSEHGPAHLRESVTALHERLEGSDLVDLDGVGHSGIASAPALLAREIRAFA
jgi:pimeloyl-ACP methyl ester carboxylesterase